MIAAGGISHEDARRSRCGSPLGARQAPVAERWDSKAYLFCRKQNLSGSPESCAVRGTAKTLLLTGDLHGTPGPKYPQPLSNRAWTHGSGRAGVSARERCRHAASQAAG